MNFKELEELINSGVKEISLTEDVMSEGNYEDGIIICTDGLIIDGNNHKIDANSLGRIFIVEAKNVTLKNIVFVNGKTNGGGGAIVNYDVNLRIINCCFKNNLSNRGIVIRIPGGGAIGSYSDMSLFNCQFENNLGFGDDGGAVYLEQYENHVPKVVLKNCDFKNNYSDGANNDFGSNGGSIYNKNVNLYLSDCRFENNGLVGWSNFDYNESIFNGGFLSLDNCCFNSEKEGHYIFNIGKLLIKGPDFNHEELILNKGSLEII